MITGKFCSPKSHNRFVLLAAYQVDIDTTRLMFEHNNNTIISDASQKSHKNLISYNVVIQNSVPEQKPTIRSLGIVRAFDKKTTTAINKFKVITDSFNEIKKLYLFKDKELKTMFDIISSTLTDHASDAKKWCKMLREQSGSPERFKLFFCLLHRIAIASRDVAILVRSFKEKTSFDAIKSTQGRFDDYKADFYKTYSLLHKILPLDDINAPTVKATPIRFLTFDRNIAVTYPIYDQIISKLIQRQSETKVPDENINLVLSNMQKPLNRFIAWVISKIYIKFEYPYLKLLKKLNNIEFNEYLVKTVFPKLDYYIENVTEFYNGEGEIFPERKRKKEYKECEQCDITTIDLKFDTTNFLAEVLQIIYNALARQTKEFMEGGQYHNLTQEEKARHLLE